MEGKKAIEPDELVSASIPSGNLLGSKTSQLDDALSQKLNEAFDSPGLGLLEHGVAKIVSEYDPIDLAYAAVRLPAQERIVLYDNLPDLNAKTIFIINATSSTRVAIFRQLSDQEVASLIANMPPDEAVWILDDMTDRRSERILEVLPPKRAEAILQLQEHDRNSAGRLMTNEFFAFHYNTTIGQVAAKIQEEPGIDLNRQIFVLSDTGQLMGYVPIRTLLINPHYLPLRQLMKPVLHSVTVDSSRDEVVDLVERYKIPALAVLDEEKRLIGTINYEDVVEAMEDIAARTIASMAGTAEDFSEHEPIFKRFLSRAPWLVVTLFAGLVSSSTMTYFTNSPWFAFVPFFIPLITGMSGNVGIQCSTILVRWIGTGEVSWGSRKNVILQELSVGLLIGSFFGLLCGTVILTLGLLGILPIHETLHPIAVTVGVGTFTACLTATTLGSFLPFIFARAGVDPAIASGPIVTAFSDVMATMVFILVARVISGSM